MLNLHKHSASCRTVIVLMAGVSTASSLLSEKKLFFSLGILHSLGASLLSQAFQDKPSRPHVQWLQQHWQHPLGC